MDTPYGGVARRLDQRRLWADEQQPLRIRAVLPTWLEGVRLHHPRLVDRSLPDGNSWLSLGVTGEGQDFLLYSYADRKAEIFIRDRISG